MTDIEKFLLDIRMRISNELTSYVCDGGLVCVGSNEVPDGADVHEDIREALSPYFEEIRERIEGPRCGRSITIGVNTTSPCRLLAGHASACKPSVGTAIA